MGSREARVAGQPPRGMERRVNRSKICRWGSEIARLQGNPELQLTAVVSRVLILSSRRHSANQELVCRVQRLEAGRGLLCENKVPL